MRGIVVLLQESIKNSEKVGVKHALLHLFCIPAAFAEKHTLQKTTIHQKNNATH